MTTFGLQISNFTFGGTDEELFDAVADRAVAADESGYSSLWVMDHFFQLPALGGPDQPILEGYTLLGALAAITTRVELGTLVTGVTYRNPALLAKMVTTLDHISKGRAVLGIGAAWYDVEHDALGFEYPSDGERLDRLEEAVQICRAMFTEDHVSFAGSHHSVNDGRNNPRPLRAGGPPIMIGGGGEKRTLKLVATYADAWNVAGGIDVVRHKLEVLHRHCADVGRDPAEIKVTWLSPVILTTSADHTAEVRAMLAGADPDSVAGFTIGQVEELPDLVAPYVEAGVEEVIAGVAFGSADDVRAVGETLNSAFRAGS